jgi:lauroyl/myristoyl acyltransferase
VIKDQVVSAAFKAGWNLVCRLPETWARRLFTFGADIAWRRQGGGVQVLEGNLLRVLGPDTDGAELRAMSRAVMRSYGRYYMETFRLQGIPAERILAGMHNDSPNVPLTMEYLQQGRGVIYALPHSGQYEAAGKWIIAKGAGSFTTVAERLKPEQVFQQFLKFRQGLGMEVLPTTGGQHPFGVMAQRLRAGKMVCLVADRDLSEAGVEVDFFGEKALMPAGPAALAVQTGAALVPAILWYTADGWGVYFYPEIEVPADGDRKQKAAVMTQRLADVFAGGIRKHPADWHMLQYVFSADLDQNRLAAAIARAEAAQAAPGEPGEPGAA